MTLAQLLVVQTHDSAIDRLVYSRANLPEFAALATLDDEQAHLDTEWTALAELRHEIERTQKRHEDEAAIVTERIDKENALLYSGSVTGHKELQALQDELAMLDRRRGDIEDRVLEAMEEGEPLDNKLGELDEKLAAVQTRRAEATESLTQSQAAIDAEIESEQQQRSEAISTVEAALVAEYESTRASCGGVGICKLIDKTCQGCHLTLASVEYDRIRKEPEGAVVRCGECTRILVR